MLKDIRWLVAGFGVGLLLAVAPACGTLGSTCSPANCTGCCDAVTGACNPGTMNTACGARGTTCSACPLGQDCQLGVCTTTTFTGCTQATCAGCCTASGCNAGTTRAVCGKNGSCQACAANQDCVNHECVPAGTPSDGGTPADGGTPSDGGLLSDGGICGPGNCAGCCDGNTCIPFSSQANSRCGMNGLACSACPSQSTCTNGACVPATGCSPASCPNGCCTALGSTGSCVQGTSNNSCGNGGNLCQSCNTGAGQSCQNQSCTTSVVAGIGAACTQDIQCAALGPSAKCKLTTTTGSGTYTGGFCTLPCAGASCPAGSACLGDLSLYGEMDMICAPDCNPQGANSCRNGYACYEFQSSSSCWLNPIPPIDPGGTAQTGLPCTSDSTCQNPPNPQLGFCIQPTLPDGSPSGWTGGTCSASCSWDQSGTFCGPNGMCVQLGQTADEAYCFQTCSTPGAGQGACRAGYVCEGLGADGGMPAICWPNCNNPGGGCGAGTCQPDGYCR